MPTTTADIEAFLRDIGPGARGVPDVDLAALGVVPAHVPPRLDGGAAAWHETHTIADRLAGIPPTPPATVPRPDALPPSRKRGTPPARLPDDARSAHARNSGLFTLAKWGLFMLFAYLIWRSSARYR